LSTGERGPLPGAQSFRAKAKLGKGGRVNDRLDVTVHDSDVLAEIEILTNLIIATSESDKPLSQRRIDEILGVIVSIPRARQP
jgi:hypothetical protein